MTRTIKYKNFEIYVHSETMPSGTYTTNESARETAYQAQVSNLDETSGRVIYATDFLPSAEEAVADAKAFCNQ